MSKSELKKLVTILAKVESLETTTQDPHLRARLGAAKIELLRAWKAS